MALDALHSEMTRAMARLSCRPLGDAEVISFSWLVTSCWADGGRAVVSDAIWLSTSARVTTNPYSDTAATMAGTRASIP